VLACALVALVPRPGAGEDCDARFIAFLGSNAYRFSPRHTGDLGAVTLFTMLSNQGAVARGVHGSAFWRLEIRPATGAARVVRTAEGTAHIGDASGVARAEFVWDARDGSGRVVPDGLYLYTFQARFVPGEGGVSSRAVSDYVGAAQAAGYEEAYASTDEVVVDSALSEEQALGLRASLAATTCQVQQNTPLEASFAYNFYYGSTHSHSNYSDGGQPLTGCSSGNAYGSGTFGPAQVYSYARNTGLDYWVINEHNHLIEDAVATNNPPLTEAKARQRYQDGRAAAAAATVNGSFIALYGMEWGVTTNNDQGHVTLLETPVLFGWDSCTSCNGPAPECAPGTNCYFDVFTPKRFGYLSMYARSRENPSPAGALGILCHPGQGEFDNYAFNADADDALQGIAVRSGLAFTTGENCSDANVGATDYSQRWKEALDKGFHLGPTADHDAHCANYGQGIPNRTVYLLPNAVSPPLTRTAILQAHRARHFFASEDSNAQLVFATSSGRIMGDIFTATGPVTLRAALYDPDGEGVSRLEFWRGQIGAGLPPAPYRSVDGAASDSFTETLTSGTYYYYVHAVQADGHDVWSAPMWITYSGGGGGADLTAAYDATLRAPRCATVGRSCDSGPSLLVGRDGKGPEPSQPNTLAGSCADGTSGTFHADESNDRLKVSTTDGSAFAPGKAVRIDATVWAWTTPGSDKLDLYYAADAASPSWTYLATLTPAAANAQTLSATYTLPSGSLQAVRARFRYQGSAAACGTGSYDDHDDLAFAVNGGAPPPPPANTAVYDATLRAPRCAAAGRSCDSGASLLLGRGTLGPEPNQPNTVGGACADGASGTFHSDESVDRLKVSTVDGSALAAGKSVRVEATVWAWSTPSADKLDLYYAANASAPAWVFLATVTPAASGSGTLSASYTLPSGSMQAVRARFRYQGSVAACGTGSYDDHDDLVFAVP
jgi:hypothetical protein